MLIKVHKNALSVLRYLCLFDILFVQNPKCLKTLKNGLKSNFGKNVNQT